MAETFTDKIAALGRTATEAVERSAKNRPTLSKTSIKKFLQSK